MSHLQSKKYNPIASYSTLLSYSANKILPRRISDSEQNCSNRIDTEKERKKFTQELSPQRPVLTTVKMVTLA